MTLLDVLKDPVELVEAVVIDDELAAPAARVLKQHLGAQLACEVLLEAPDVRILPPWLGGWRWIGEPPDQGLGFADRQTLLRHELRHLRLLTRRGQTKERTRVTHFELALLDEVLCIVAELEQAEQVTDGGARPTDGVRSRLMRHLELANQPVEGARFLEWIQVLALDVLDQGHGDRGFVGHAANHRRHVMQARHLRGAPASLAGDDLVAERLARSDRRERPDDDRLDDALGANRVSELLQALRPHVEARLIAAALQQVDRDSGEFLLAARR